MIRVAVVDEQARTRDYLKKVIDQEPGLEVVGTGESGSDAVELAATLRPEVLMLDLSLSDVDGTNITRTITEERNPPAVLAMTDPANDDLALKAIRAGAIGVCTKVDPPDALVRAVRTVAAGESVVSPPLLHRLLHRLVPTNPGPLRSCSPREVEVLALTANGATNPEIAEKLVIAEATVRTHVQNLRLKLGARNRVDLVVLGHRSGLTEIAPPDSPA